MVLTSKIISIGPTIDDVSRRLVDTTEKLWRVTEVTTAASTKIASTAVPLPASPWPVPVNPVLQARFGMPRGSTSRRSLIAAIAGALIFSFALCLFLINSQGASHSGDSLPGTVVELLPLAAPDFNLTYSRQVTIPAEQVDRTEPAPAVVRESPALKAMRPVRKTKKPESIAAAPSKPEVATDNHGAIDDNPY